MSLLGAVLGLLLSAGVTLVVLSLAARRPIPIRLRIDPYLGGRGAAATGSGHTDQEVSTLAFVYGPLLRRLMLLLHRTDSARLDERLIRAGLTINAIEFRFRQLTWALGAVGSTLLLCTALHLAGREVAPAPALVLVVLSAVVGWLAVDHGLTRSVRQRNERILASLPSVAELLALAVASGESAQAALERVGRAMTGPLADECARACVETSTGVSFIESLEHMADRLDVVAIRRFVDGISIAVSRGTPVAEVLRAQAADARADHHRILLEIAGRKEVLMLIPLVFLILPTVVLVALFPAVNALTSVSP
jgi:tight adherence protein C